MSKSSEVKHDYVHWPLKEKHVYEHWRATTSWGRLFEQYQGGGYLGSTPGMALSCLKEYDLEHGAIRSRP